MKAYRVHSHGATTWIPARLFISLPALTRRKQERVAEMLKNAELEM
jgi:hypothetical protein